jgi:UDP-N-acetylmuramate--alanine ligase
MQDIKRAFLDFMDRVPFYGMLVLCNDDPILRRLLPRIRRRMIAYGTRPGSDFLITTNQGFARNSHRPDSAESGGRERPGLRRPQKPAEKAGLTAKPVRAPLTLNSFQVSYRGADLGEFCLHVPGMHNVLNATAAIAVGIGLDIPVSHIREALENFRGVDRRFQLRGEAGGVAVIDDYGHHPTEIKATLAAARQCGYRKIHVIFQPHRYTRTRDLMDEFTAAFGNADSLFVLDIYPASEQPIEGITAEALARKIAGTSSRYVASFEEAVGAAATAAQPGDMILTLGAGSVSQLGPMLLEKLQPSASGSGRKQPGMEVAYRPDDHQG